MVEEETSEDWKKHVKQLIKSIPYILKPLKSLDKEQIRAVAALVNLAQMNLAMHCINGERGDDWDIPDLTDAFLKPLPGLEPQVRIEDVIHIDCRLAYREWVNLQMECTQAQGQSLACNEATSAGHRYFACKLLHKMLTSG